MGGMRPMGGMGAPLASKPPPFPLPSPAPSPSHRPEAHNPVSPPHNTVEKGGSQERRTRAGIAGFSLTHMRLAGAPPRRRRDAAADDAAAADAAADGRDDPARDGHATDGHPGARPVRTRLHA